MKELIDRINASIKQVEWEQANTKKYSNAWYLMTGRLNGYKHVLEMIISLNEKV